MSQHIHLIGIGGSGLSAIAQLLHEAGYTVSGSDQVIGPLAADLVRQGIPVSAGHQGSNIAGADVVVRSSAIPDDNPEVVEARKRGIPVLKRSEFLGRVMEGRAVLAIAGTHGKTTTTGMLAYTLSAMGLDPSYIVGGTIRQEGRSAHSGQGSHFVIEADEYDRMFLGLHPYAAVITSVEWDHPDCFPTPADYRQAFLEFARSIRSGGTLLLSGDEPGMRDFAREAAALPLQQLTYGLGPECVYRAVNLRQTGSDQSFDLTRHGEAVLPGATISLPGRHNVLNTLAVLALLDSIGIDPALAAPWLPLFSGTGRRFEVTGEVNGITLVDDYAHHPTAIRATLAAARSRYGSRRLIAVWQPHTYSRTRLLAGEFIQAFDDADQVILTEIYAAREAPQAFSARSLAEQMDPGRTRFIADLGEVARVLGRELRPGDVVLVLSAGDAIRINQELAQLLGRESK